MSATLERFIDEWMAWEIARPWFDDIAREEYRSRPVTIESKEMATRGAMPDGSAMLLWDGGVLLAMAMTVRDAANWTVLIRQDFRGKIEMDEDCLGEAT